MNEDLRRWVRVFFWIVVIAGGVWFVWRFRDILSSFALAIVVAYIFFPLIEFLEKKLGLSRLGAILVFVLSLAVLGVGAFAWLLPKAVRASIGVAEATLEVGNKLVQKLVPEQSTVREEIESLLRKLPDSVREALGTSVESLTASLQKHLGEILSAIGTSIWGGIKAILKFILNVAMGIFNIIIFFVVVAYALYDHEKVGEFFKAIIPQEQKQMVFEIAGDIDTHLRAFFRGQLLVSACLGGIYAVGLSIVGIIFSVPLAILIPIGLFAGLANIVPYFGVAVGLLPSAILAGARSGGLLAPLMVCVVFGLAQIIEGTVLTPRLVGKEVGLHPVLVIGAIIILGQLLGFLGILFAVPLAATIKVSIERRVKTA